MNDIAMMKNQDSWPCWPFLPLKHRGRREEGGFPLIGVMFADNKPNVYISNMYSGITDDTPIEKFSSFDEIVTFGWEVD